MLSAAGVRAEDGLRVLWLTPLRALAAELERVRRWERAAFRRVGRLVTLNEKELFRSLYFILDKGLKVDAAEGGETALANLLNIIGRRDGARSVISIG